MDEAQIQKTLECLREFRRHVEDEMFIIIYELNVNPVLVFEAERLYFWKGVIKVHHPEVRKTGRTYRYRVVQLRRRKDGVSRTIRTISLSSYPFPEIPEKRIKELIRLHRMWRLARELEEALERGEGYEEEEVKKHLQELLFYLPGEGGGD